MDKSLQLKVITRLQDKLTGPLKGIMGASKGSAKELKELKSKLKGLESTQKNVDQFRNLKNGLKDTSDQLVQSQQKVAVLAQKMKDAENPTAALKREFNRAKAESKKLTTSHDEQSRKLQAMRDKLSSAGISTKNLGTDEKRLRENIQSTNQALDRQKTQLSQVAQQQRKLTAARDRYQKTTSAAANLAVTGAAGYMTGRRALSGMAGFMQEGMDFDKEMSKVQALTRLDKNSDQMQSLREQARQLGATTAFTSTDAAAGQAFLGMAGFTPEAIKAAMPGVLDMALAGDMDLSTTADISSNILTGMGLQADQMTRVADVMTGAFTRSNTDIRMLGETMKYAAPVAAQFGVDLETATAMAAKLGDAGIQGSMGGTAIRRIIGRLAAPNKAAREAIAKLGVEVADSTGKMRPITELLSEIYERSSKLTEIEQGQIYKAIGGEQGVAAMGILAEQAGLGKLQELQNQLYDSAGEASKNAASRIDNAMGDIELLKSAWADVSIEVFSQNNDSIREVIQTITSAASAVGNWAKANPALVSTMIKLVAVVAALAVGLGGIAITIAGILGPFAMMRYAFTLAGIKGGILGGVLSNLGRTILPVITASIKAMGVAIGKAFMSFISVLPAVLSAIKSISLAVIASPVTWVILGIAAAAFVIYKYWEPIKSFFSDLWSQIKTAFNGGISSIAALILSWSPIGLFYSAFASVMDYFGIELPDKFTEFGSMIIKGLVNGIKNMSGAVKDAVVDVGSSAIGWFKEKLGIESPSRVFMGLGGFVSEGAAAGIKKNQPIAEKAAKLMAAGVMSAGVMSPAIANINNLPPVKFDDIPPISTDVISSAIANINNLPPVKFDDRPPISAQLGSGFGGGSNSPGMPVMQSGGDHIEINIYPTAGMQAQDIAQAVARELDKREREKRARGRSALTDYGN